MRANASKNNLARIVLVMGDFHYPGETSNIIWNGMYAQFGQLLRLLNMDAKVCNYNHAYLELMTMKKLWNLIPISGI